ncbi:MULTISPECIES: SDR family NAD(P)-dependent oxidoreductase [unclassified Pseudomonas]|uniref:SDR family NAD(P)-dependent oxidoreductase n=1 Tax=unclassified Pseudomonas TaxID=196821 RepID=UPI0038024356
MHLSLNGKRALISGSMAGQGVCTAIELATAGAEVVLNDCTQAQVDAALKAVREQLPRARIIGVVADLGCERGVQTLLEQVPHTDILVNNVQPDVARRLERHYARGMAERKWGQVIDLGRGSEWPQQPEAFAQHPVE